MEITGLGLSFIGAVLFGLNTWASSFNVWITGSMKDKLQRPIAAIVGLGIITIGFGLQFVAAFQP